MFFRRKTNGERTSDVLLCLSRSPDKHSEIDSRKSSEKHCSITRLGSPYHCSRSFRYFSYSCIFACKPITILQLRSIPTSTAGPRGDDIYDIARLYQHVQYKIELSHKNGIDTLGKRDKEETEES